MGYGTLPYAGAGDLAAVGEQTATIIYLEGNDRHQAVMLVNNGVVGSPEWSYWNPAVAPWAEALASPDPGDYPPFFALNDAGNPPIGTLQSTIFDARPGTEIGLAAIVVDFAVRPSIMDDHDGGLGDLAPRFTVFVEGWGVPGVTRASTGDALATSVVRSAEKTWTAPDADDLSVEPWPHHRSVRLPCRLDQRVRSYRITVTNVLGVEILAVTPWGVEHAQRTG